MKKKQQLSSFEKVLLDALPIAVFYKDREGRYLGCNQCFTEIMGVTEEQIIGKTAHDLWPSQLADIYHQSDIDLIAHGSYQTYESKVVDKNGMVREVSYNKGTFRDDAGEVGGLIGIFVDITERNQLQGKLEKSLIEFTTLADNLPFNIARWDLDKKYLYANPTMAKTMKMAARELVGKAIPVTHREVRAAIDHVIETGEAMWHFQQDVYDEQGKKHTHEVSIVPELDREGRVVDVLGFGRDMTEFYETGERLRKSEQEFRTLAENSPDFIFRYDKDCRRVYVNQAVVNASGISKEQLLKRKSTENQLLKKDVSKKLEACIKQVFECKRSRTLEIHFKTLDGRNLWYDTLYVPEFGVDGSVETVLSIGRDITDRKNLEERLKLQQDELQFIAHHDSLTGLPNRVLLEDRMRQGIAYAKRYNASLVVAYLDLDKFKPINDIYGHETGDYVLKIMGERMTGTLREVDTVARIGGDEFVVVLSGMASMLEIESAMKRLLDDISIPIPISANKHSLSASIGISIYPEDGTEPEILLRNADQAMYVAKKSGRDQYVFFGSISNGNNGENLVVS